MSEEVTKPGHVWVCGACGKQSETQYGFVGKHSRGWDVSCVTASAQYPLDRLVFKSSGKLFENSVIKILEPGEKNAASV